MKNKYSAFIFIAAIAIAVFIKYKFFYESVEIKILAPTNVNLTSGWPNDPGNRIIGVLPTGGVFKTKTLIVDDHMVYQVKFQSPVGAQTGFVMFDGYCGSSIIEIRTRHSIFGADERLTVNCLKKK